MINQIDQKLIEYVLRSNSKTQSTREEVPSTRHPTYWSLTMSHFSVLVISPTELTTETLGAILQPWHEFECTGKDDQYVQDVDITEEALSSYHSDTMDMLRSPEGEVACDLGAVVVDAVNEADVFVWDAVQNHVSAVIMKEMGRW